VLIGKGQRHIDVMLGGRTKYSVSPIRLDVSEKGLDLPPPVDAFSSYEEIDNVLSQLDLALGRADRAVFWYWSQVLRSAPLLLARRAGQIPAQRVGLLLLVYLTALLAINIWECLKLFAAQSISQRCCRPSRLNSKVRI